MNLKLAKNILPDKSLNLLKEISNNPGFNDFVLVGGTALSLQIGHRESIDLDFFSNKEFDSNISDSLKKYNPVNLIYRKNSIEQIVEDTKVSFLFWGFKFLYEILEIEGVRIADPRDIGLFKLLALQGGSTKKDIIDLYFIDKEVIKLDELFEIFEKNYPKESFNIYDSVKNIFDTEKINNDPMPVMHKDVDFEVAVELVQGKVARHLKALIS